MASPLSLCLLFAAGLALGGLLGVLIALLLQSRRRALALQEEQACLQAALDPVRKEFATLSAQLSQSRTSDAAEAAVLRQHLADNLQRVSDLVLRVDADAKSLRNALQGNVNLRGQWGEAVLETLLQNSGLQPGIHYERQRALKTTQRGASASDSSRPDILLRLPEGSAIAIDSKMLFPDYARLVEAQTPEESKEALRAHLQTFRNTVHDLASRHYEQHIENSVDFVLMFLPIEGAYQAAVSADPTLLTDALSRNILPVGPSSLILMLTLIQRIWRREEEHRNTRLILAAARTLVERTLAFDRELATVGSALTKAQTAYDDAMRRLHSTDGRSPSLTNSLNTLKTLQGDSPKE